MPKLKTPEQLRQLLEGVRWSYFLHKSSSLNLKKVRFHARIGLHMGRPMLAIMAQGQFVILQSIQLDRNRPSNLGSRLLGGIIETKDAFAGLTSYAICAGPVLTTSPSTGLTLMHALSPYYKSEDWDRQILNIKASAYVVAPYQIKGLRRTYRIKTLKTSRRGLLVP